MKNDAGAEAQQTRAGFVALVGRPNVGKSTLLNALVGERLSIVTPRAQTTREPVTGILTGAAHQIVFVDTPGLLEPRYALQRSMQEQALQSLRDADTALLLLDASRPKELPEGEALAALRDRAARLVVATNKVDAAEGDAVEQLAAWSERTLGLRPYPISAADGAGLEALRGELLERLPESPFFYPEDDVAVQSVRFFVSEFVREAIFELYDQEVPYSSVVRIEEFREGSTPLFIRATVYVERESQKAIIVGRQGAGIRRLGEAARVRIESFLGQPVYLDLWVKALPNWRRKTAALQYLGYRVPAGGAEVEEEFTPPPEERPVPPRSAGRAEERGRSGASERKRTGGARGKPAARSRGGPDASTRVGAGVDRAGKAAPPRVSKGSKRENPRRPGRADGKDR